MVKRSLFLFPETRREYPIRIEEAERRRSDQAAALERQMTTLDEKVTALRCQFDEQGLDKFRRELLRRVLAAEKKERAALMQRLASMRAEDIATPIRASLLQREAEYIWKEGWGSGTVVHRSHHDYRLYITMFVRKRYFLVVASGWMNRINEAQVESASDNPRKFPEEHLRAIVGHRGRQPLAQAA